MLKKISILICCVLMIQTLGIDALAASSPVIYSGSVTISDGEDVRVPVLIKNNTGLMGFHFTMKYDPDKITITNVTSSELTSDGLFNQNLNKNNGTFDVIWSNAENVSRDGPIFYLYIRSAELDGETSIKLDYTADDTFDESFENVEVTCRNISISKAGDSAGDSGKSAGTVVDSNPEEDYIAGEISDVVTSQLDQHKVIEIANSVMKEEGIDGISKIKPEHARRILTKISDEMEAQGLDNSSVNELILSTEGRDDLDSDKILSEAVIDIYKSSVRMAKTDDQSINVDDVAGHKFPVKGIIIALICLAILAEAIILFFRRKKKMGGT